MRIIIVIIVILIFRRLGWLGGAESYAMLILGFWAAFSDGAELMNQLDTMGKKGK